MNVIEESKLKQIFVDIDIRLKKLEKKDHINDDNISMFGVETHLKVQLKEIFIAINERLDILEKLQSESEDSYLALLDGISNLSEQLEALKLKM